MSTPQPPPADPPQPPRPTTFEELREEFAELQRVTNEQIQINANLQRDLAAARAMTDQERLAQVIVQAVQPPRKKAKVPPPNVFNGDKEKLPVFKMQLGNWLRFCDVSNEEEKIRLAVGYMKEGEAAEWVVQKDAEGLNWTTYDDFFDEVEERFGDVDPEYTAREKLKKLRQGNSVEKLNTEFKKCMVHCHYTDTVLIEKYQDCLNNETLEKFYYQQLPRTLQRWMSDSP